MEHPSKRQRTSSRRNSERQQPGTNNSKFWYDELDLDDPTFGIVEKRPTVKAKARAQIDANEYEEEDSIPTAEDGDDGVDHDDGHLDDDEIEAREQAALAKIRSKWDNICKKYGEVSKDMDVIDFKKLQVVVDNGHLAKMQDAPEDGLWDYGSDGDWNETVDKTYSGASSKVAVREQAARPFPSASAVPQKRALSASRDRQLGRDNAPYTAATASTIPAAKPAEVITQVVRQPVQSVNQQLPGAPMQYIVEETVVTTTRRYVQIPGQGEQMVQLETTQPYRPIGVPTQNGQVIQSAIPNDHSVPPVPVESASRLHQLKHTRNDYGHISPDREIQRDAANDHQIEELYDSEGRDLDDYDDDDSGDESLADPGSTKSIPRKYVPASFEKRKPGRPRKIPIETINGKKKVGRPRKFPIETVIGPSKAGREPDMEPRNSGDKLGGASLLKRKKMPGGEDHWTYKRKMAGEPVRKAKKPEKHPLQPLVGSGRENHDQPNLHATQEEDDNALKEMRRPRTSSFQGDNGSEPELDEDQRDPGLEDAGVSEFKRKKRPSGDDHWTRKRLMAGETVRVSKELELVPQVKRKRGRPPKVRPDAEAINNDNDPAIATTKDAFQHLPQQQQEDETPVLAMSQVAATRSASPPKLISSHPASNTGVENEVTVQPETSGENVADQSYGFSDKEGPVPEAIEPVSVPQVRRKRGRPPKTRPDAEAISNGPGSVIVTTKGTVAIEKRSEIQSEAPNRNGTDKSYDFSDEEEDVPSTPLPPVPPSKSLITPPSSTDIQEGEDVLMEDPELDIEDLLEPPSLPVKIPTDPALLHVALTMAPAPLMTSGPLYGTASGGDERQNGDADDEEEMLVENATPARPPRSEVVLGEHEDAHMLDADGDDDEDITFEPSIDAETLSGALRQDLESAPRASDISKERFGTERVKKYSKFPQETEDVSSSGRKRRGRPGNLNEAALFRDMGLIYADDDKKASLPTQQAATEPQPKRRGRPPKAKPAPELEEPHDDDDQIKAVEPLAQIKRPRGRPRKTLPDVAVEPEPAAKDNATSEPEGSYDNENQATAIALPAAIKRPRGRPRKSLPVDAAEPEPNIDASTPPEPKSIIQVLISSSPKRMDDEPTASSAKEAAQLAVSSSVERPRIRKRSSFPEDPELDAEDQRFGRHGSILTSRLSMPPSLAPETPSRAKKQHPKLPGSVSMSRSARKRMQELDNELDVMPFRLSQSPAPGSARRPISLFSSQDHDNDGFKKPFLPSSQSSKRDAVGVEGRSRSSTPINRRAIQAELRAALSRETPVPGTPRAGTPAGSRAGSVVSIRSRSRSVSLVPDSASKRSKAAEVRCGDGYRCGRKSCFKCSTA